MSSVLAGVDRMVKIRRNDYVRRPRGGSFVSPRSGRGQAGGSLLREETFATLTPPISPLAWEMSRSDRGVGSSDSDQIGLEMGSPPLPSASPPQGGRRGLTHRSPRGGRKGPRQSSPRGGKRRPELLGDLASRRTWVARGRRGNRSRRVARARRGGGRC